MLARNANTPAVGRETPGRPTTSPLLVAGPPASQQPGKPAEGFRFHAAITLKAALPQKAGDANVSSFTNTQSTIAK